MCFYIITYASCAINVWVVPAMAAKILGSLLVQSSAALEWIGAVAPLTHKLITIDTGIIEKRFVCYIHKSRFKKQNQDQIAKFLAQ